VDRLHAWDMDALRRGWTSDPADENLQSIVKDTDDIFHETSRIQGTRRGLAGENHRTTIEKSVN
jgi:hypothetical protein